jgi:hypothetical protein
VIEGFKVQVQRFRGSEVEMIWVLMLMTVVMVTTIAAVMARNEAPPAAAPVRKSRDRARLTR